MKRQAIKKVVFSNVGSNNYVFGNGITTLPLDDPLLKKHVYCLGKNIYEGSEQMQDRMLLKKIRMEGELMYDYRPLYVQD